MIVNTINPPRYDIAYCQTMDTKQEIRDCLGTAEHDYNNCMAMTFFCAIVFCVVAFFLLNWWIDR